MFICMKDLCIVTLKPLYTFLIRDMKHICNRDSNPLVRFSYQKLKIKCKKLAFSKTVCFIDE